MDKAKPIFKKPGRLSRGWKVFLGIFGLLFIWYLFCLPRNLFKDVQYSTMVLDRNGKLIGARIADDGQWRFPPYGEVPEKYATALIQFEDQYFKYHPGVNPISIIRALIGNIRSGKITSGGSTITMQVIRL
ncbi:MAG: transglycosylase domain-containing protein, partial [Ruminococcus sp.]|nr:transglycosylase domain-containing protein [Ruminococcus sp.]